MNRYRQKVTKLKAEHAKWLALSAALWEAQA